MITREQLQETYGKLSDNRLSALLNEKSSLSDEARQVLEEEVKKRNLNVEVTAQITPKITFASKLKLPIASPDQRFINRLIDGLVLIAFYFVFFVLGGDLVSIIDNSIFTFLYFTMFFTSPLTYYTFTEGKYGKTLGKYVTKTTVLNQNGTKITFLTAFLRTLCRLIPFNFIFVFLDDNLTLHDKLTGTYVSRGYRS